jgi:hypothetical protein
MDEKGDEQVISLRKLESNRSNGQKSTGPKTELGKRRSRRNAIKHGILASALLVKDGIGAEDAAEFQEFFDSLHADLEPIGALETMLVEKIAVCFWRQKRALRCEAGFLKLSFIPPSTNALDDLLDAFPIKPNPERDAVKDHHYLPLSPELDRILRYETAVQRQLMHAINQLERMQRARRGERVPAPLTVEISEGI